MCITCVNYDKEMRVCFSFVFGFIWVGGGVSLLGFFGVSFFWVYFR